MNNCEKQIILISIFENGIDLNNFCSNGNIFYDICRTFDSNVVHNYFFTKPVRLHLVSCITSRYLHLGFTRHWKQTEKQQTLTDESEIYCMVCFNKVRVGILCEPEKGNNIIFFYFFISRFDQVYLYRVIKGIYLFQEQFILFLFWKQI